ncbi:MAG: macro domain-containing protein [Planctomycetota bacterium]
MIENARGNLLEADAEALVNTVNCVGYMGKGIALQFKQAFPENFKVYERACEREEVRPGKMLVYETGTMHPPRFIINFPTKRHWRGKSRIEDIEAGLVALVEEVKSRGIRSIAVPPLGCGNGGLEWPQVRARIVRALEAAPDVRVLLFEPAGVPAAATMPVNTERSGMTPARALFVKIMQLYMVLAYRLTLLEIQKLAYFLQEAGQPLKLKYEEGHYGPYATNLNKVLERIEGHFTRGYGDSQKPDAEIELLDGAVAEADAFLADKDEEQSRLVQVSQLIEGFETPYGMELLSSVHWVAVHGEQKATSAAEAVKAVHAWNDRKARMFSSEHIETAWARLDELHWLSG